MTRKVNFGPLVKFDLADAHDWYERQEEGLGDRFLDAFDACVALIKDNPRAYPVVHRDVRRSLVRRFPYLVFYRVLDDAITVIGRFHGKRDPQSWQERR